MREAEAAVSVLAPVRRVWHKMTADQRINEGTPEGQPPPAAVAAAGQYCRS